jgi:hypothetical protein
MSFFEASRFEPCVLGWPSTVEIRTYRANTYVPSVKGFCIFKWDLFSYAVTLIFNTTTTTTTTTNDDDYDNNNNNNNNMNRMLILNY